MVIKNNNINEFKLNTQRASSKKYSFLNKLDCQSVFINLTLAVLKNLINCWANSLLSPLPFSYSTKQVLNQHYAIQISKFSAISNGNNLLNDSPWSYLKLKLKVLWRVSFMTKQQLGKLENLLKEG